MGDRALVEPLWVWDELRAPKREPEGSTPVEEPEPQVEAVEGRLEEAFQLGYEQGAAEGHARAREELETALSSLSTALQGVHEAQSKMLADVEENIAALSIGIARQLVVGELEHGPETMTELVREAISSFALDAPLTVILNPSDLAVITADGAPLVASSQDVRWQPDPTIARGGCLVEGPGKIVDGRLDLALERIYRVINGD